MIIRKAVKQWLIVRTVLQDSLKSLKPLRGDSTGSLDYTTRLLHWFRKSLVSNVVDPGSTVTPKIETWKL